MPCQRDNTAESRLIFDTHQTSKQQAGYARWEVNPESRTVESYTGSSIRHSVCSFWKLALLRSGCIWSTNAQVLTHHCVVTPSTRLEILIQQPRSPSCQIYSSQVCRSSTASSPIPTFAHPPRLIWYFELALSSHVPVGDTHFLVLCQN
jgi:hypothetical protein